MTSCTDEFPRYLRSTSSRLFIACKKRVDSWLELTLADPADQSGGAAARRAAQEGLPLQALRLPEEVLRVLPGKFNP
eukprot:226955-Prorocentrum_minimum.AAC.2